MAEKAKDALRTIGELSRELGIRTHILRYWEEQFPTLQPLKRAGGRRYYRPEDVELVQRIDHLLNKEGYTVKGAVVALKSKNDAGLKHVGEGADNGAAVSAPDSAPESLIRELKDIRDRLEAALARS